MSTEANANCETMSQWTEKTLMAIRKIPGMKNVALLERSDVGDSPQQDPEVQIRVDETLKSASDDVKTRIRSEIFGLGPLDALVTDHEITEILVLGQAEIWIEKQGRLQPIQDQFHSDVTFKNSLSRIARIAKTATDFSQPFADGRWNDFRIHTVGEPISQTGPQLTLRRVRKNPWTLEDLEAKGWSDHGGIEHLKCLVREQANVLVIGGTGSGKTSALAACLKEIGADQRCVILEDTDELPLPNRVSAKLLTKRARTQTDTAFDLDCLLRQALRMRPDRIILGEVRGAEAKDLLMSFATGHRGCWGTLHAASAKDALMRLEMLVQMGAPQWNSKTVRQLIHSAVDAIVCIQRDESGVRRLESVSRVAALEEMGFCFSKIYCRK